MNPSTPSPSTRGPQWRRVSLWAVPVALLLVGAIVWASFFSGPRHSASTAEQSSSERAQDPATDDAQADDGASEEPDGSGKGNGASPEGPGGSTDGRKATTALDRSLKRFRAAQRRLAARVSQQLEERTQPVTFRVATFNVLGDSHTGPGGNKPAFYPDASPRMDMAIATLRNNGVDVVGFQEFESTQHNMFASRAGEYSLYPGLSLGTKSVRFNIAWRSAVFSLVEAHTLSVPYAGGSRIEMPVVLLESTATGRRAWFANFHNPADTPSLGNNGRWRAEGAALEVAHLTALHAEDGYPVIVTGDFNERSEIFCRFTAGGVFSAAAGGSTGAACAPPPSMQVDWIFGSTGVAFDGYAVTDTGRASDHAMVQAQATLTEAQ
ncbi:Metal-dependent hydrolase, endonuclease/exonuclease/phosphatase family [Nocardioides alpinus]|uniref:Metal-dependent hydrolase, endonuclease/exonuclease/phosphatase family n=1 Tax=Nocardioides alpinus TaxID=748909 RepID=A0A1I1BGZ7_9ACTN|nr:endonuclease/exonuclease/phosphatase family protein [Nocardioides alpinus]SFB49012.1 Metal-dependent hydrolase, endonuclease/exonuclease/phosphatase family [Nocardioides alpinus]